MQRFTISLDDALAAQFDELIATMGYENRSEAVRDLIRARLSRALLPAAADAPGGTALWCVATVNFVYDHHDRTLAARVLALQHDHHDLVVSSLHTQLGHDDGLEAVVLRGPLDEVHACAQKLLALRGVRHGHAHVVPLAHDAAAHHHPGAHAAHGHHKPLN
ncbi:nickel-responsive transcriptional regulator NikR [Ottowia sp.]|uniref:nickel-responsive transcriptional regulator NikR n=1 Tax=Ottowia sp. TaxID=1898956 RepID=UPI0039E30960